MPSGMWNLRSLLMLILCKLLAHILTKLGRKRVIMDHIAKTKEYLHRFYILGRREHKWFVVCLHHILRSDRDGLHSHPASYYALVLTGGYWEKTLTGKYWRGPGSFRFRSADSFHKIELGTKPTWTIFIMLKRTQDWGFLIRGKFIPHEQHLGHKSP